MKKEKNIPLIVTAIVGACAVVAGAVVLILYRISKALNYICECFQAAEDEEEEAFEDEGELEIHTLPADEEQ